MKDLIQEGRKIQETFKKNVIKDQTLNEAQWEYAGSFSGVGEHDFVYRFEYKQGLKDRLTNFFDRIRKSGTIGNIPSLDEIRATYRSNANGKKEEDDISIIVAFKRGFFPEVEPPYVENIRIDSKYPFTQYKIEANMFSQKKTEKILNNPHVNYLAKKLISELKPEIEKAKNTELNSNKLRDL